MQCSTQIQRPRRCCFSIVSDGSFIVLLIFYYFSFPFLWQFYLPLSECRASKCFMPHVTIVPGLWPKDSGPAYWIITSILSYHAENTFCCLICLSIHCVQYILYPHGKTRYHTDLIISSFMCHSWLFFRLQSSNDSPHSLLSVPLVNFLRNISRKSLYV